MWSKIRIISPIALTMMSLFTVEAALADDAPGQRDSSVTMADCFAGRDVLLERYPDLFMAGAGISRSQDICSTLLMFESMEDLVLYVQLRRAAGENPDFIVVNGKKVEVTAEVLGQVIPYPSVTVGN